MNLPLITHITIGVICQKCQNKFQMFHEIESSVSPILFYQSRLEKNIFCPFCGFSDELKKFEPIDKVPKNFYTKEDTPKSDR